MTADLDRFYDVLAELEARVGRRRLLGQCTGRMAWPQRGVYFFFEPGEVRRNGAPRVVRVGTHAVSAGAGTSVWSRLRAHRGTPEGGHHRGSIFRLLVGEAILARSPDLHIPTWGVGSSSSFGDRPVERELERRVSQHLGVMPLLWLPVLDEPGPQSMRADVERNSVALLSGFAEPASLEWLGADSPRPVVRDSGLWNQAFVGLPYDPSFLQRMRALLPQAAELVAAERPGPSPLRLLDLVRQRVHTHQAIHTLSQRQRNVIEASDPDALYISTSRSRNPEAVPWAWVGEVLEQICLRGSLAQHEIAGQGRYRSAFLFALLAETLPEHIQVSPGTPLRLELAR